MRSVHRFLAVTATWATSVALLVGGPPLGASGAAQAGESRPAPAPLLVEVGYDGYFAAGHDIPVWVTVKASRLMAGDLVVRTPNVQVRRPDVEVAGGSVKRFIVLLPGGDAADLQELGGFGKAEVKVELRHGDEVLARGNGGLIHTPGTELVGFLPGVLGGKGAPAAATLSVEAGEARFFALAPADMGLPGALAPLSHVGLRSAELAALGRDGRESLTAWVAGGGRLLVDDEPAGPLAGLPPSWTPAGGEQRAEAGRGEVRLTGGALAGGRLAGLVDPTARGRSVFGGMISSREGVAQAVGWDAGLRLPGLGLLLGFLGVYVGVVGPLTAVVLRRRRRPELAWVVVPALAVAFTVVAYGAGSASRSRANVAHSTVVTQTEGGDEALTYVGVTRRGSGTARVGFPQGWVVRANPWTAQPAEVADTGAGPEARVPLAVGQFAMVNATGPVDVPGDGLEVRGSAGDGARASGTVRNRTPFTLDEVTVFVGEMAKSVGRLRPGQEKRWEVDERLRVNMGDQTWFARWPGDWSSNADVTGRDGVVNLALWQEVRTGPEEFAPGVATAVGWTRGYRPEFAFDGNERKVPGRTAFVGHAPLRAEPGRVPHLATAREVLRGPMPTTWNEGPDWGQPTVTRFTLPDGADPARPLEFRSTFPLASAEVWVDGAWRALAEPPPGAVGPGGAQPSVAPEFFPGKTAPTTLPPPIPETFPLPPPQAVPPGAELPPPPPFAPPIQFDGGPFNVDRGFGPFSIDASGGLAIPPAAVRDGRVVYVRAVISGSGPDFTFTVGEAS